MTQHTPGPWDVRPAQRWHVSDKPFTLTTYELHGGPEINDGKSSEVNANARLIASAPTMLAALRAILDELNGPMLGYWSEGMDNLERDAREVIAKATGES